MNDLFDLLGATGPQAPQSLLTIITWLAITLALTLLIATVYQRTHDGALYTQNFVQTLVLVGLVASIVLQIVGQNVAAAFAIFGAFSIIRFRNAVPETRDVGFIFFTMVIGLAVGAGLYALAVVATTAICATIVALSHFDLFAPERTSHTLRVRVTTDVDYSTIFRPAFEAHLDRASLRRVESVQGGLLTELTYAVRLKPGSSPRDLVDNLQRLNANQRIVLIAAGPDIGG